MKDQFANYVVQKIIEICNEEQRERLLNRIRGHLQALKKYTYGKHIVARLEQLSGEGAFISYTNKLLATQHQQNRSSTSLTTLETGQNCEKCIS